MRSKYKCVRFLDNKESIRRLSIMDWNQPGRRVSASRGHGREQPVSGLGYVELTGYAGPVPLGPARQ